MDDHPIISTAPLTRIGVSPDRRTHAPERSRLVPHPLDIAFGLGIWVAATAALVLLGDVILPGPDDGFATILAYLVICLATFAGTFGITGVRARVGGDPLDGATGLRLGAVILIIGLFLDGVLLAQSSFAYPNVDAERTETIAVAFLLAYPLSVVGPWLAGLRAEAARNAQATDLS